MATKNDKNDKNAAPAEEPVAAEVLDFPGEVSPELADARAMARQERFSDDELRAVASFEDAFALATQVYGDVTDVSQELGNGFTLITDKAPLVGTPFVILSCSFNDGDFGTFASIAAVTKDNKKVIFNDGSSGVHNQLFELVRTKKRTGGFLAPNGLTASTYDTCPPQDDGCSRARPNAMKVCQHCGNTSERRGSATTYFLNLAPSQS